MGGMLVRRTASHTRAIWILAPSSASNYLGYCKPKEVVGNGSRNWVSVTHMDSWLQFNPDKSSKAFGAWTSRWKFSLPCPQIIKELPSFPFLCLLRNVNKSCDESQQFGLRIGQHKISKYNLAPDDVGCELFIQSDEELKSICSQITTFLQMTHNTSETDHSDLTCQMENQGLGMQKDQTMSNKQRRLKHPLLLLGLQTEQ